MTIDNLIPFPVQAIRPAEASNTPPGTPALPPAEDALSGNSAPSGATLQPVNNTTSAATLQPVNTTTSEAIPQSFVPVVAPAQIEPAVPAQPASRPWAPAKPPDTVEETITCYVANDAGNAQRFLDACGEDIRYCAAEEQWYAFNDIQWEPVSETHIEQMAYRALEASYLKEVQYYKERNTNGYMDGLHKNASKESVQAGKIKAIQDCVKTARLLNIIEPEDFDSDPNQFHAKNSSLNLKTFKGWGYNKKDMYFTRTAGANLFPDPPPAPDERYVELTLDCPNWIRFVACCAAGDRELFYYLKKAAGYSVLSSDISEQKVFCLLGSGRNGKSLFINTLAEIAGDYACKIEASLLCKNKFNEQHGDTAKELYRMKGSRFVYSNEFSSSQTLNEGFIKAITDGGKISCRAMYKASTEYTPTYKLWFSTNHMPNLQTMDEGIRRRIVVIPFRLQIPEDRIDRTLPDKLRAEYDQIMLWLVEGYHLYLLEGLEPPEAIRSATACYFEEQDVFQRFLNENYVKDSDGNIPALALYQHYQAWCVENGEKAVSNAKFGQEMTRLDVERVRGRHGNLYRLTEK